MDNMMLYNAVCTTPENAKKKITGGRLNGMTDINPMYRIKMLTEQFGPCGVGWYTEIINRYTEQGASGEVMCFVDINLYFKNGETGEWSKPVFGTGGSMLVQNEKNGLRANDEGWKMAYTDAISVACKALGMGADVYWEAGRTKYSQQTQTAVEGITEQQLVKINQLFTPDRIGARLKHYKIADPKKLSKAQASMIISARLKEIEKEAKEGKNNENV